jgi:outer membrane immunogenic protein
MQAQRWREAIDCCASATCAASGDRSGWAVGGGVEWMFAPSWSVFCEYNYMDFGRRNVAFTAGPGTIGIRTINSTRLAMQTALIGVNSRFNWAGL